MPTIAEIITSMGTNLDAAYDAAEAKNATMPEHKNLANLASTIETVSTGLTPVRSVAISTEIGVNDTVWLPTDGSPATTYTLAAAITPADATVTAIDWRTSDSSVMKIEYNGVTGAYTVKPIANGSSIISATAVDGSNASQSKSIQVRTHCTGMSFSRSTVNAAVGNEVPYTLNFTPATTSERGVTFVSSDESVVKFEDGKLMAKGAGTATITATATDGGYTSTLTVTAKVVPDTWAECQRVVQAGEAEQHYNIGDKIATTYTDNATGVSYNTNLIVMDFTTVEKEGTSGTVPAMVLMFENSLPFTMQFDAAEPMVRATEEYALDGVTYYSSTYAVIPLSVGDPIPYSDYSNNVYKTGIAGIGTNHDFISYGYNRWSHSGIRQFLNSDGERGNWWTPAHVGDAAPSIHTTKEGFLSGLEPDFLAVVNKVKVGTSLNTVTDDGSTEYTYDRFFLPSMQEMCFTPDVAGAEGHNWEYIRTASSQANARKIIPMGSTSAAYWWLRSAYRSNSNYVRYVNTSGSSINSNANTTNRCVPACVIC